MPHDITGKGGPLAAGLSSSTARHYDRMQRMRLLIVAVLAVATVAAFLTDLTTGPSGMSVAELLRTLLNPHEASPAVSVIVWQLRLPQSLMALLVGCALGLAGAQMQTILGNPLADPFTLGVSSASAFGASLAIVLGLTIPAIPDGWAISANAFLFAFAAMIALQFLARARGGGAETLALFGVALSFTFSALLALVQFLASADALQQLVFWTMGSLTRANWNTVLALACVVAVVLPLSLANAWKMTVLRLGEERAATLGVNVRRLRYVTLFYVCLLSATAVSFVGIVGFVGLTALHIARMLTGEDHRFFLPASALVGMAVMAFASAAGKSLAPGVVIPIGIVTALIGLPIFFALLMRRGRE